MYMYICKNLLNHVLEVSVLTVGMLYFYLVRRNKETLGNLKDKHQTFLSLSFPIIKI